MSYIEQFQALPAAERQRLLELLPAETQAQLLADIAQLGTYAERTRFYRLYPTCGPFARHLYPKHMEIMAAGVSHQYRAILGGNGTGKTLLGAFETTCHATGEYPDWWTGYRTTGPARILVAGDTKETVRDTCQRKLLGDNEAFGTGVLPASKIGKIVMRQNGNGAVDFIKVRHVSGGWSTIQFKSYDQGRKSFQGMEQDFIWLDEECPMPIYEECVQRFRGRTVNGRLLLTFTPLEGVTDVVLLFLPQLRSSDDDVDHEQAEFDASRTFVMCSWEDIPHMTDDEKRRRLGNTLPYMREARMKGMPTAGRGRVFTVPEDFFVVDPFRIPAHFPRAYGMDFGFGKADAGSGTAAVWGAWDRDADTLYLYDEYLQAEAPPSTHAAAVLGRPDGRWIRGVGDYAGKDLEGQKTLDLYRELGLLIEPANKSVDAGLLLMTQLLNEGRLRVFSTLQKWLKEYRLYSIDERNRIIKKRDHLMDATRYLCMTGPEVAGIQPILNQPALYLPQTFGFNR